MALYITKQIKDSTLFQNIPKVHRTLRRSYFVLLYDSLHEEDKRVFVVLSFYGRDIKLLKALQERKVFQVKNLYSLFLYSIKIYKVFKKKIPKRDFLLCAGTGTQLELLNSLEYILNLDKELVDLTASLQEIYARRYVPSNIRIPNLIL